MEKQRFKEALRSIMGIAQIGNSILQDAAPWKHIKEDESDEEELILVLASTIMEDLLLPRGVYEAVHTLFIG